MTQYTTNGSAAHTPGGETMPSPVHSQQLTEGSGIAPDVAAERAYRTSSGPSELKSLGLFPVPRDAHGLIIPLFTTEGKPAQHYLVRENRTVPLVHYRPDTPDTTREGEERKYVFPTNALMSLDCHPRCQPDLTNAAMPLWVTEGEKKGDAMVSHGACVIDIPGVNNWQARGWDHVALQGRDVRIVFDNDVMRKKEVKRALYQLKDFLTAKGALVRVAYLPAADDRKVGVDDYLLTHSLADLERLLRGPREPVPVDSAAQPGHPIVIDMETVQAKPIEWLWWPYLAIGKICVLDGDPGVGKTLFATQLAANVSRGHPMPDQDGKMTLATGEPGVVVFVATEDDLEDTVKPRLEQAGADCTKIKAFNEWEDGAGKIHAFTLADLPHLEHVLQQYRPRLVYIDAIQAVLGGKVDANSANQLKQLLDPLAKLAAQYRCAILASRHPAKPGQNNVKLIHRGANSMAIIGTARLGLFAEDHPIDRTKVLLLQSKSNAGAIGRTQIFSKAGGKFEWDSVSRITKEDLAGSAHGPDSRLWLGAYFWLEKRLEGGLAWLSKDIEAEAISEEHDFTTGALRRAKKALGIISAKGTEPDAAWTWRLPPQPRSTPPTSPTTTTTVTSSTSTSLNNSTTYHDDREDVEVDEEVEEVEEVEVDGVVSKEIPPLTPLPATDCYPGSAIVRPCYPCRKDQPHWLNAAGEWKCAQCHPYAQRKELTHGDHDSSRPPQLDSRPDGGGVPAARSEYPHRGLS